MKRSAFFADRITHFLRGYRKKNGLTQGELAAKIGTTKSTVSRMENDQDKQVVLVLSMIESLGRLEKMDLGDFLAYLDAKKVGASGQDLFPWQRTVVQKLAEIKQSVRLDLMTEVMELKPVPLEQLLTLTIRLNRLSPSSREVVDRLVTELLR